MNEEMELLMGEVTVHSRHNGPFSGDVSDIHSENLR